MNTPAMNLNDYFDVVGDDDIRIKGTRVGIETVLEDYLDAVSPEEIAVRYPTLTLEQVYATITYYFHNKKEIGDYLDQLRRYADSAWKEQVRNLSPAVKRLREMKRLRLRQIQEENAYVCNEVLC